MDALKQAINRIGGAPRAASVCGISVRAIYKWTASGSLPRTEYTGETDYAARLAEASASTEQPFTADWLLANAAPKKAVAA